MDAATIGGVLASVLAAARADLAAATPTLVSTLAIIVLPLAAEPIADFDESTVLASLDICRLLAGAPGTGQGRAALLQGGVPALLRALAASPQAAPAARLAASRLLQDLDHAGATPVAAPAPFAASSSSSTSSSATSSSSSLRDLRAVQLRMDGLLGRKQDEDQFIAALLQDGSVSVTSVSLDSRREVCVCYTREAEDGGGLKARLYAVVQRVADRLRDAQGKPRVDMARKEQAARAYVDDDDGEGESNVGSEDEAGDENFFALVAKDDHVSGDTDRSARDRLGAAAEESGPVGWLASALKRWW